MPPDDLKRKEDYSYMFNYGMCNHCLKMRGGTNEAYFAAVRLKQLKEPPFQLGNSRPPSIKYGLMTGPGSILTLSHAVAK